MSEAEDLLREFEEGTASLLDLLLVLGIGALLSWPLWNLAGKAAAAAPFALR